MLFYLNSLFAELVLFFVSIVFNVILIFIWLIQSDDSMFNKSIFSFHRYFSKVFFQETPGSLPMELPVRCLLNSRFIAF